MEVQGSASRKMGRAEQNCKEGRKTTCKLKSCIVLKDRIFCPDYDSHDRMLSELGVEDTRENAERLFVRVELSPIDDDVFSPINTWRMKVDQDILPDWWVAEAEEPRVREAVAKWAKDHIFCDAKNLDLKNGTYYLKNSSAKLYGNSIGIISSIIAGDRSNYTLKDNATLKDCKHKVIYQAGDWKLEEVPHAQD